MSETLSELSIQQQAPFSVHSAFNPVYRSVVILSNIYGRHIVSLLATYNTDRKAQYVWGHILDERYRNGYGVSSHMTLTGPDAVSFRVHDPLKPKRYSVTALKEFATTCELAMRDVLREWAVPPSEMTHDLASCLLSLVQKRVTEALK